MHAAIAALKNGLGYAKIADDEVHDALHNLVDKLGDDLENLDGGEYEPGARVEAAITELEVALNNTDSDIEDVDAAIKTAEPFDDDDDDDEDE